MPSPRAEIASARDLLDEARPHRAVDEAREPVLDLDSAHFDAHPRLGRGRLIGTAAVRPGRDRARRPPGDQRQEVEPAVGVPLDEGPGLLNGDALDRHPARPVRVHSGRFQALDRHELALAVAQDGLGEGELAQHRQRERGKPTLDPEIGVGLAGHGPRPPEIGPGRCQVDAFQDHAEVQARHIEPDLAIRLDRAAGGHRRAEADARGPAHGPSEVSQGEAGAGDVDAAARAHCGVDEGDRAVLDDAPADPEVERRRRGCRRCTGWLQARRRGRCGDRGPQEGPQGQAAARGALDQGPRLLRAQAVDRHGGRPPVVDPRGLQAARGQERLVAVRDRQVGQEGGTPGGDGEGVEGNLHPQVRGRLGREASPERQVGLSGSQGDTGEGHPEVHPGGRGREVELASGGELPAPRHGGAQIHGGGPARGPRHVTDAEAHAVDLEARGRVDRPVNDRRAAFERALSDGDGDRHRRRRGDTARTSGLGLHPPWCNGPWAERVLAA